MHSVHALGVLGGFRLVRTTGHDGDSRCHDVRFGHSVGGRAATRERSGLIVGRIVSVVIIGGTYGDGVQTVSRASHRPPVRAVVTGCDHHGHSRCFGRADSEVDRVEFSVLGGRSAQRHIDNLDVKFIFHLNCGLNRLDDVRCFPSAFSRQNFHGDDVGFLGRPRKEFVHSAVPSRRDAHVGTVTVIVVGERLTFYEIDLSQITLTKVGVRRDTGVQYSDRHSLAAREVLQTRLEARFGHFVSGHKQRLAALFGSYRLELTVEHSLLGFSDGLLGQRVEIGLALVRKVVLYLIFENFVSLLLHLFELRRSKFSEISPYQAELLRILNSKSVQGRSLRAFRFEERVLLGGHNDVAVACLGSLAQVLGRIFLDQMSTVADIHGGFPPLLFVLSPYNRKPVRATCDRKVTALQNPYFSGFADHLV